MPIISTNDSCRIPLYFPCQRCLRAASRNKEALKTGFTCAHEVTITLRTSRVKPTGIFMAGAEDGLPAREQAHTPLGQQAGDQQLLSCEL